MPPGTTHKPNLVSCLALQGRLPVKLQQVRLGNTLNLNHHGEFKINIFILSNETTWAKHLDEQVQFLADRHVIKMIAESTQMLVTAALQPMSTVFAVLTAELDNKLPCKPLSNGMAKHPCTEWTEMSPKNFNYLAVLALAMCYEHQHRYPLSPQHAYMTWLQDLVEHLTTNCKLGLAAPVPTHFAVAIKDHKQRSVATVHHDAVDLYRDYYVRDKHKFATWKRRAKPVWFLLREEELTLQGRL